MTQQQLQEYITDGKFDDFAKVFMDACGNTTNYLKQYNTCDHDVIDKIIRPDKKVFQPTGEVDSANAPIVGITLQPVNRIAIPLQQKITKTATNFLMGNAIEINATAANETETSLLDSVKTLWKNNKLNYKSKDIARRGFSETEVAEIWFPADAPQGFWQDGKYETVPRVNDKKPEGFKIKVIAASLGDTLSPVFDDSGDMIAFGRGITLDEVEHLDIYTAEAVYKGINTSGTWTFETIPHDLKKIPVIYYSREYPLWHDVQTMIDRLEKLMSNFADTVDYNGSPITLMTGKIESMPLKGEAGKVVELEPGADAKYLTWDQVPEAIKFEYETLRSLIMTMTSTPDISFEQMKAIGAASGIALKLLFMDAHMNAAENEELWGEYMQRRINLLKHFAVYLDKKLASAVDMNMEPKFTYFLPEDVAGELANIATAKTAGVLSQESGVELSPLTRDAEAELKRIKDEVVPVAVAPVIPPNV